MSHDEGMKPRLLLVEDDAVSRVFLAAALEALPARVDVAETMAEALSREDGHDLWLLDANLPDGSGAALLRQLRRRSASTPALAHTADDTPALHAQLIEAGFAAVLVKPLSAAELQEHARACLGMATAECAGAEATSSADLPLWDEATALAALKGNREHVATLRAMFLGELPRQRDAIFKALQSQDHTGARRELHQLKASSGFVGALRLNAVSARLERALTDRDTFAEFDSTLKQTLSSA